MQVGDFQNNLSLKSFLDKMGLIQILIFGGTMYIRLLKSLTLNVPQANFKKRTTMQCNVHFSNIISLLTRESGFVEPRNLIFFTEMMLNDVGRIVFEFSCVFFFMCSWYKEKKLTR